jgi:hypothetical protein
MLTIHITISRRGMPARRITGLFASSADAVISTMDTLGHTLAGARISAKVAP